MVLDAHQSMAPNLMMKILLQSIQGLDCSQWYYLFPPRCFFNSNVVRMYFFYNFSLFALALLPGPSVVRFVFLAFYSYTCNFLYTSLEWGSSCEHNKPPAPLPCMCLIYRILHKCAICCLKIFGNLSIVSANFDVSCFIYHSFFMFYIICNGLG
jgi:hypothetical protein